MVQVTQVNVPPNMIDFGIGQPDFNLLPLDFIRRAAAHRLSQADPACLNYGAEQGDGYLRLALADFLSAGYGIPVAAEQLFITAGASQALDLICTLFTRPGDVIFVEEPSYFLALRIFADHGLRVIGLPIDEDGLIVEALEAELAKQQPVFLYTIPTFQNPTGVTLSQSRRERLVALSQAYDFYIVADEVYHLLNYTVTPPRPLAHHIEGETVLSVGSFSKILAPGLRLGWVQAAPTHLARLFGGGLVDSGGGLNPFTSAVVRSALELGFQHEHLAFLKQTYRARVEALGTALQRQLAERVAFSEPEGGFFFWLTFPEDVDTEQLLAQAQGYDVGFQPGIKFSSREGLRHCARLSFAFYDASRLQAGVARLKRVLE